MLERLVRLYPRAWRARYGDELAQLVTDLRPGASRAALAFDLIRSAVTLHLREVRTMNAHAMRVALSAAAIVWLGVSAEIVLSNVVFPSKTDDDLVPILVSYACIFAAFFLVGRLSARHGANARSQVLAGVIAGAVIGAATVATFAVVDNVWLDIVSRQQAKIDGFAHSGASSMRAYINQGLIGAALFLTAVLAGFGALLSRAGGLSHTRRL
ncbi:MAG TPA: hypothetical protein VL738_40165 [Dactylosporangium sp.]|nr:hypothetical protein [Dactylosporangium sp.]